VALLVSLAAPLPASGQTVDLAGIWQPAIHEDQPERLPGPELGDYLGLPITDGARRWAESWDPSRLTLPEHQCQVHIVSYIYRGPLNLRIWTEKDPKTQQVVAIRQYISTYEQARTIWMDGRPHPSENTAHTWMGFSTGRWDGDALAVETTHIKQGWIRRNGLPASDRTRLSERFVRHGNYMTHISVMTDPVYLTEPLIKTETFALSGRELPEQNWLWVCESVDEIAGRPAGAVPAYMPNENPFLAEFQKRHNIPVEAARGGAETAYPEFMRKMKGVK
jgi:hypothetical protein